MRLRQREPGTANHLRRANGSDTDNRGMGLSHSAFAPDRSVTPLDADRGSG